MNEELKTVSFNKIQSNALQSTLLYSAISLVIFFTFQLFNQRLLGFIIASTVALVLTIFEKISNPGSLKHYVSYMQIPNHLSGNFFL